MLGLLRLLKLLHISFPASMGSMTDTSASVASQQEDQKSGSFISSSPHDSKGMHILGVVPLSWLP